MKISNDDKENETAIIERAIIKSYYWYEALLCYSFIMKYLKQCWWY